MVSSHVRLTADSASSDALRRRFDAIRRDLEVPGEFDPEVLEQAARAAEILVQPPGDATDAEFFTIDPPTSMDLDQAMCLDRDGQGYRVRYAIADVPAFIVPGSALDRAAWARGQTIYAPDGSTPLHPRVLSEGAASLLPGAVRSAYVWDLRVDGAGAVSSASVARALVRSRERFDYVSVQAAIDAGSTDERFTLLREIGGLRVAQEIARGGASLQMPEQEVHQNSDDDFELSYRPPVPVEDWNAQISLMTGMAAADLMLEAKVGILRTMPAPWPERVKQFRRQASALGVPWSADVTYGQFLRSLDRANPLHLALTYQATRLFRGASYTAVDGAVPKVSEHAALAAPYAHVTAPLRRLVDRFGLVIAESICAGREVPSHVRAALTDLPQAMQVSGRRASAVERACIDAVEAAVLAPLVGQRITGFVVDEGPDGVAEVHLREPAIVARVTGEVELGAEVLVDVVAADILTSEVDLRIVT